MRLITGDDRRHAIRRGLGVRGGHTIALAAVGLLLAASPASAQWSRVTALPASDVFAFRSFGDTIAAGVDTAVYVSTDAGTTWHRSAKPTAGVVAIDAVWVRNQRLYAGTFGQGVFVSDDLGATWAAFNQGLVGGAFDTQLDVSDFEVRGDSLYAATLGAGVYVRSVAHTDTWHHFGEVFEPNQASNVNDLALGGTRLLASAGGNGTAFIRDPGDPEWTITFFSNVDIRPGLSAQTALWTGDRWVVGTSSGVFLSADGEEPWTHSTTGPGVPTWSVFAPIGPHLFAAFSSFTGFDLAESDDDGTNWSLLETVTGPFAYQLAAIEGRLYAARSDGLWIRSGTASVSAGGDTRLRFALAGPQPVRDVARLRFELPRAATTSIEVFDVTGRRVSAPIEGFSPAGPHEVSLEIRDLPPGVYAARLTSGGMHETVRLVRVR